MIDCAAIASQNASSSAAAATSGGTDNIKVVSSERSARLFLGFFYTLVRLISAAKGRI